MQNVDIECFLVLVFIPRFSRCSNSPGVSGEKLEIDPVSAKGAAKFFKQKAVTIDGEHIASCDMLEEKNGEYSQPYVVPTIILASRVFGLWTTFKRLDLEEQFSTLWPEACNP